MRRKSLLLLVLLLALPAVQAAQADRPSCRDRLNELVKRYNATIYASFYALTETRPLFISVCGDGGGMPWNHSLPSGLTKRLQGQKKELLLERLGSHLGTMADERGTGLVRLIGCWCAADAKFDELLCIYDLDGELMMEAVFAQKQTRPAFAGVLKNRKWDWNIDPAMIGETLSSAEYAGCYLEALNLIAHLTDGTQWRYFAAVYTYLADKP